MASSAPPAPEPAVVRSRWVASWWRPDHEVEPRGAPGVHFRVGYDAEGRPVVVERFDGPGRLTSVFRPCWGRLAEARQWRAYRGSVRPWRRWLWRPVERFLGQRPFVRPLALKLVRAAWRPDYLLRVDRFDADGGLRGAAVHVYFPDGLAAGVERYDAEGRFVRFSAAH